jgi:MFS family permease
MDKKWWTLLAVCTGTFMLLLDVTIVIVAQPAIQGGLHASFSDLQWVLDAYALTLASLLLTSGVLADRYGRKRLFQIGLVIFTLGSLLCGVAQDPLMLVLSRSCLPRRWRCSGTASAARTAAWRSACGVRSPASPRR